MRRSRLRARQRFREATRGRLCCSISEREIFRSRVRMWIARARPDKDHFAADVRQFAALRVLHAARDDERYPKTMGRLRRTAMSAAVPQAPVAGAARRTYGPQSLV